MLLFLGAWGNAALLRRLYWNDDMFNGCRRYVTLGCRINIEYSSLAPSILIVYLITAFLPLDTCAYGAEGAMPLCDYTVLYLFPNG